MALTIKHSNIKFRPMTGASPKIRGSKLINALSWTDEGSGVYSINLGYPVHWLTVEGQNTKLASVSSTWIDIADLPAANQVEVDPDDLTGADVVGAYVVCRNRPYSFSRGHKVTAYDTGVMTLERPHGYNDRTWVTAANALETGVDGKLMLYGLASYVTNDYDFAFEDGVVYVKLPSAPSNFVIRAVSDSIGIKVKASGFNIADIEMFDFFRAAIVAGCLADSLNVNCDIHHCHENPVVLNARASSQKISGGEFTDWCVRGAYLANQENAEFSNMHVHSPDTTNTPWLKDGLDQSHYTGMGLTSAGGIKLNSKQSGSYLKVNDNIFEGTPWCGVHLFMMNGEVLRNQFYDCLVGLGDGGSIYSAWGLFDYPTQYSLEIAYNKIRGIPSSPNDLEVKRGIFQDNGSGGNNVHHNVIWDYNESWSGASALFVNSGSAFQKFHHNIVIVKSGHCLRHRFVDFDPGIQAQGVEIHDNIFIVLNPDFECMWAEGNIFQTGGFSNNNYFITPYAANRVARNDMSLATWQGTYSQDADSRVKENWLTYVDENTAENVHIKLYTNETGEDVQQLIPAGYEDIDGNDVGGQTLTVPAYYGLVVLKTAN